MTSPQGINILCAANADYAMPLTVMLTSLVCNFKTSEELNIYIIESDIPAPLRDTIEASILNNKKGKFRLSFHWKQLDKSSVEALPVGGHASHLTRDSYARLFAPELLPKSCERVIYLDCDLVVLRDIAELNNSVDGEHTVAAVSGVLYPYVSSLNGPAKPIVFNYADLGIPASNRYFQCGVMVINLQLWRQQNVTFRVINYLETHKEDVVYLDQGGLNAVLYDQWSRLDQRWNQTGAIFFPERWASPAYSLDEWHRTKNDPFIVHYDGGHKPWNAGFRRPRASFFYKYLKKTHFKRQHKIPAVALLEGVIGYKCYFFLWRSAKPIFANFKARMGLFVFWKVGKREWARGKS